MAAGRVLLFIDELHILMDAGRVEGGMNAGEACRRRLCPRTRRGGTGCGHGSGGVRLLRRPAWHHVLALTPWFVPI